MVFLSLPGITWPSYAVRVVSQTLEVFLLEMAFAWLRLCAYN